MNENLQIQFLGGAETVTGSKILITYQGKRILIDCGLFQGVKKLRLLNWKAFPIPPESIDAILLTHAHLDHCGYIPVLVKNGFKGEIHCTYPTVDLAEIILKDSGKIQEEEAERANLYGYTRHKPAKPLYTIKDALRSMPLFIPHNYKEWVILGGDMKFCLRNSGHILGAAMIELKVGKKKLIFSGDIGREKNLLLHHRSAIKTADLVVMESTYGDRFHPTASSKEELRAIIQATYRKKGILFIPTFAVERAQELLFLLAELKASHEIPNLPIYLDSPMGVDATRVILKNSEWHKLDEPSALALSNVGHLISDAATSRKIVADKAPKIVLAGSGMITGGRILHYLNNHIQSPRNTILLVGFQAEGTRGRSLLEGATELKFFGQYHQVGAEVQVIHSLSAHADQRELLTWLRHFESPPKQLLLNHGELHQANALRVKIEHELGWNVQIATTDKFFTL